MSAAQTTPTITKCALQDPASGTCKKCQTGYALNALQTACSQLPATQTPGCISTNNQSCSSCSGGSIISSGRCVRFPCQDNACRFKCTVNATSLSQYLGSMSMRRCGNCIPPPNTPAVIPFTQIPTSVADANGKCHPNPCLLCPRNCIQPSTANSSNPNPLWKCSRCPFGMVLYAYHCLTKCPAGHFKNYNASMSGNAAGSNNTTSAMMMPTTPAPLRCGKCNVACKSCFGPLATHCMSCPTGKTLCGGACQSAGASAPQGYYIENSAAGNFSYCKRCPYACTACSNYSTCTACRPDHKYLVNGQCKRYCPAGTFKQSNSSTTCTPCASGITYCYGSATNAYGCAKPKLLLRTGNSGSCVSQCPNGTVAKYGRYCQKCAPKCATCSGNWDSCTTCNAPWTMDSATNTCVSPCTSSQTENNGACRNCTSPCASCSGNVTSCTRCLPGQSRRVLSLWPRDCMTVAQVKADNKFVVFDTKYQTLVARWGYWKCRTSAGSSPKDCTSCRSGYFLRIVRQARAAVTRADGTVMPAIDPTGECVKYCGLGYYGKAGNQTNQTNPTSAGAGGNQTSNQTSYPTIPSVCQKCPPGCRACNVTGTGFNAIINCTDCGNYPAFPNGTCITSGGCPPGFAYDRNQQQCVACVSPCKTCSVNPRVCDSCYMGYLPIRGKCINPNGTNGTCNRGFFKPTAPGPYIPPTNYTNPYQNMTNQYSNMTNQYSNMTSNYTNPYQNMTNNYTNPHQNMTPNVSLPCVRCRPDCFACTNMTQCSIPCSGNCSVCDSSKNKNFCLKCADPNKIANKQGQCVSKNIGCGPGMYNDPFAGCSNCSTNCNKCFGPQFCLQCNNQKPVWMGRCVNSCPTGTTQTGFNMGNNSVKVCAPCPQSCSSCNYSVTPMVGPAAGAAHVTTTSQIANSTKNTNTTGSMNFRCTACISPARLYNSRCFCPNPFVAKFSNDGMKIMFSFSAQNSRIGTALTTFGSNSTICKMIFDSVSKRMFGPNFKCVLKVNSDGSGILALALGGGNKITLRSQIMIRMYIRGCGNVFPIITPGPPANPTPVSARVKCNTDTTGALPFCSPLKCDFTGSTGMGGSLVDSSCQVSFVSRSSPNQCPTSLFTNTNTYFNGLRKRTAYEFKPTDVIAFAGCVVRLTCSLQGKLSTSYASASTTVNFLSSKGVQIFVPQSTVYIPEGVDYPLPINMRAPSCMGSTPTVSYAQLRNQISYTCSFSEGTTCGTSGTWTSIATKCNILAGQMVGGKSYMVKVNVTSTRQGLRGTVKCMSVTVFMPRPKIRAITQTQIVARPSKSVKFVARTNQNASQIQWSMVQVDRTTKVPTNKPCKDVNNRPINPQAAGSRVQNFIWKGEYSTLMIPAGFIKPSQICQATASIEQTTQDPTTQAFTTTSVSVTFTVSVPSATQAASATVRAYCGGGARKGRADITRRIFCKCKVGGTAGGVNNRNVPIGFALLDAQGQNANATLGSCIRFYKRSKAVLINKDCLSAGQVYQFVCTLTGSAGTGTLPATKNLDTTENTNLWAEISPSNMTAGDVVTATINVAAGVQDSFRGYVGRLVTSQSGDQNCRKITRITGQADFKVWRCGAAANNYTVTFCFRGKDSAGIKRMYTAQATVYCKTVSTADIDLAVNDNDESDGATSQMSELVDSANVPATTKAKICGAIVSNLVKKGLSAMTGTSDVAGLVTKSIKSVFMQQSAITNSIKKLAVDLLDQLCSNAEKQPMATGTFENINNITEKITSAIPKTGSSPSWVTKFKAAVKKCRSLFAANCPVGLPTTVVTGTTQTTIMRVDTQDLNQQGTQMSATNGAGCTIAAGMSLTTTSTAGSLAFSFVKTATATTVTAGASTYANMQQTSESVNLELDEHSEDDTTGAVASTSRTVQSTSTSTRIGINFATNTPTTAPKGKKLQGVFQTLAGVATGAFKADSTFSCTNGRNCKSSHCTEFMLVQIDAAAATAFAVPTTMCILMFTLDGLFAISLILGFFLDRKHNKNSGAAVVRSPENSDGYKGADDRSEIDDHDTTQPELIQHKKQGKCKRCCTGFLISDRITNVFAVAPQHKVVPGRVARAPLAIAHIMLIILLSGGFATMLTLTGDALAAVSAILVWVLLRPILFLMDMIRCLPQKKIKWFAIVAWSLCLIAIVVLANLCVVKWSSAGKMTAVQYNAWGAAALAMFLVETILWEVLVFFGSLCALKCKCGKKIVYQPLQAHVRT